LASSQRTWEHRFEKLPEIDNKLVNDGLVVVMVMMEVVMMMVVVK
jgi:hypothetical protein